MGKVRPKIPEELQRQVRQYCGYGCALCGKMPTTIEHIVPFSKKPEHVFGNLVLLCANCHQDVTSGRIGKNQVYQARSSPFSRRNDRTHYTLNLVAHPELRVGSQIFRTRPNFTIFPFSVNGLKPIGITFSSPPRISLRLPDRSGTIVVSMDDNVLNFRPGRLWDVLLRGNRLRVKFGDRKTLLDCSYIDGIFSINTLRLAIERHAIVVDRIGFLFPGKEIQFSETALVALSVDMMVGFRLGAGEERCLVAGPEFGLFETNSEAWKAALSRKRDRI